MVKQTESRAPKKGPDLVGQKLRKAKRCLQSSGKRGLDAYCAQNTEIKSHKTVQRLLDKAALLPVRPPKGKRGPRSKPKTEEVPETS